MRDWAEDLGRVLRDSGFTLLPRSRSGGGPEVAFRAVRGHCEVHVARSGDRILLSIPVVRLGPERPVTERLTQYLDDRNASGKGPGVFQLDGDTVWYRAHRDLDASSPGNARDSGAAYPNAGNDAARYAQVAATALAMQETVERLGPKILNLLR
ncbi:MAG: hypothetical protein ACM3WU_01125 [Bacillota bacterium]